MFPPLITGNLGVILRLTRRLLRRRISITSYLQHTARPFLRLLRTTVYFLFSVFTLLQIIDMNQRYPPESASRITCVDVDSQTLSLPRWRESGGDKRAENVVTVVGERCELRMRAVTPRDFAWWGC
ncbi:uncharacterized protein LAJ45_03727 [Morchella importuna]|uniref:uncharacterized protein n=1 Tax=Morchella importuna TaxID=1174673 RepID=UPI001E8D2AC8|nr:uncharacterized protein LAJ45_03727 [Morchella importuna]KAH8152300.1 hypothetical protein LAJ45_03727 [Morchella importuna]